MSISEELLHAFPDEAQRAHMTVILSRLMAAETLVELIWAEELLKAKSPVEEAEDLRASILGKMTYDPDDPVESMTADALAERFDKIVEHVKTLHKG